MGAQGFDYDYNWNDVLCRLPSNNGKVSDNMSTRCNNDTDMDGKYIIFQPGDPRPPTVSFDDRPEAIKVAFSMAKSNPGKQFCVCKIVGSARTQDVKYVDFD